MRRALVLAGLAGCAAPRAKAKPPEPPDPEVAPLAPQLGPAPEDPNEVLAKDVRDPDTELALHIHGFVEVREPGRSIRTALTVAQAIPHVRRWRALLDDPARSGLSCMTADYRAFGCVQTGTGQGPQGPVLAFGICAGARQWQLASVLVTTSSEGLEDFLGDLYTRGCAAPR